MLAVLVTTTTTLVLLGHGPRDPLARADQLASAGSLVLALATLLFAVLSASWGGRESADRAMDGDDARLVSALEELAAAVRHQWTDELAVRRLLSSAALRLWWSSTTRPVQSGAAAILGTAVPGRATRLRLRGSTDDLVAALRSLPAGRLVIVGEPGAGKTVLVAILTLGLLAARAPGEPVPVLLSLSSWEPDREHLHTWLIRQLATDYPALVNTPSWGWEVLRRLVRDGHIVPVLDGLDELPAAYRGAAVAAINRALAGGGPVVVTSRATDFEAAVGASGSAIERAAAVEIQPSTPADAIAFLRASLTAGDTRWEPVFDHLLENPDGSLASALAVPLMIDLARTAYRHLDSDPAELCDVDRFRDRAAVEAHLLRAYLPAVYGALPPAVPSGRVLPAADSARLGIDLDQARRTLAFLAHHLRNQGGNNLAWWQLRAAAPAALVRLVTGALVGAPLALVTGAVFGPRVAVVVGVTTAGVGAIALFRSGREEANGQPLVRLAASGVCAGLVALLAWPVAGPGAGAVGGMICGLTVVVGDAMGFGAPPVPRRSVVRLRGRTVKAGRDLRRSVVLGLPVGLIFGVVAALDRGLFAGLATSAVCGAIFVVAHGLLRIFRDPVSTVEAPSPVVVLREDRNSATAAALVYGVAAAAAGLVATASLWAVVFGVAVGLAGAWNTAWGQFVIVRWWLGLTGRPLRLMRFLEDAHRRGVLRRHGPVYQFRHALLQEVLAPTDSRTPPAEQS